MSLRFLFVIDTGVINSAFMLSSLDAGNLTHSSRYCNFLVFKHKDGRYSAHT